MEDIELIDVLKCCNCVHYSEKESKGYCALRSNGKVIAGEDGSLIEGKEETKPDDSCSLFDRKIISLRETYLNIVDIYKKYCDINEDYFPIISCWVIGSYLHKQFQTYPYLYVNAMKGSGKTRFLKLTAYLCGGEVLNSLTEAVLFRNNNMLSIDEFESVVRKGNENLIELLNSAYKQGCKVKRMKKKKINGSEEQVVEEFDVYRPIAIANISGMNNVLSDRCIPIIIEKSDNKKVINLVEIWESEKITTLTKKSLNSLVNGSHNTKVSVVCVDVVSPGETYKLWNDYILSEKDTTLTTYNTYNTYTTHSTYNLRSLFEKLVKMDIDGRNLELTLPLLIVASFIGEDILDLLLISLKKIINDKKSEDFIENTDISLYDFISQEPERTYLRPVSDFLADFKTFLGSNEEWMNPKWFGRALSRLKLVIEKRRKSHGSEVILNIRKAQEKLRQFK